MAVGKFHMLGLRLRDVRYFVNTGHSLPCVLIFCVIAFSELFAAGLPSGKNITDSQGRRQGAWVILFDQKWKEVNDTLSAHYYRLINYKDDLPMGLVSDHYRSGEKQWQGRLLKDRPEQYDGEQTWYYQSGQVKSKAIFVSGELSGDFVSYLRDGSRANAAWETDLYELAYQAAEANDYVNAEKLFQACLPHIEALLERESEEYADILAWLSIVYHHLGKREQVVLTDKELLSIYRVIRDPGDKDLLGTQFDVARGYKFLSQWSSAELNYREFLFSEKKSNVLHENHGLALIGLGEVLIEQQKFAESLSLLEEAKSHYAKHPPEEPLELNYLQSVLTRARFSSGQWTEGKSEMIKELAVIEREQGRDSEAYANALVALGNFSRMNGHFIEAERLLTDALNRLERKGSVNPVFIHGALIPLIEVYLHMGKPQLADPYVMRAKKLFSGMDQSSEAFALTYSGFLRRTADYYDVLGRTKEHLQTLSEWSSFTRERFGSQSIEYLMCLSVTADHYIKSQRLTDADGILNEAIAVINRSIGKELSAQEKRQYAKLFQQAGSVALLKGASDRDYDQAKQKLSVAVHFYNQLAEQNFIPERIDVVLSLALIKEYQGETGAADALYQQCLNEMTRFFSKDHISYAHLLFAIAKKAEIRKDHREAAKYYREAVSRTQTYIRSVFPYLSTKEKEQFFAANETWIENFKAFVINHHQAAPGLTGDLYDLLLANKGIVIRSVQSIRKAIASENSRELTRLYQEWSTKKDLLSKYLQSQVPADNVERLTVEVNDLEKRLSLSSTSFSEWNNPAGHNWRQVKKRLSPKEAAIEILRVRRDISNDSIYVALLINHHSENPQLITLGDAGHFERRQLKYYRNCITQQVADTKSFDIYFKPLVPSLQTISIIYFSPDGIYHLINPSTLWDPEQKQYVVNRWDVRPVISTSLIYTNDKKFRRQGKISIVAHPTYGNGGKSTSRDDLNRFMDFGSVAELPGTLEEKIVLSNLFNGKNWRVENLSESDASEERVKAIDNPSVLHIATHGFFLGDAVLGRRDANLLGFNAETLMDNPLLRSGLLFAGCRNQSAGLQNEDGVLTAFEASTLSLAETSLVVLSACETGLGEVRNGEGVYGLQRAFLMAGVSEVLMSLWKVDDQATQEFMVAFYNAWIATGDSRSALKAAQEKLSEKYPAPYYWGAFTLTGKHIQTDQ